jgi:hypothetical protein
MTTEWPGILKSELLWPHDVAHRNELSNAVNSYNWNQALKILSRRPTLVNETQLDEKSLYSPLHQAAHGNAPVEIVQKMIEMGAWRMLKNADGERPIDIARRKKSHQIIELLQPVYNIKVPDGTLNAIQNYFHEIILNRAGDLIETGKVRLPELGILLEIEQPHMWFPVPGMYGGFDYWLDVKGQDVKLISESWSRIVEGSGQRHEISNDGWKLVEESFV